MEIRKALPADLPVVAELTRHTIREVYPHYYPQGVVEFFLHWHRDEKISQDIQSGKAYLLVGPSGQAVGTVTLHGEELNRLFVLPEHQGKGYGRLLLDFGENMIGQQYGKIVLDSSLPGKAIYLKRGYQVTSYQTERQENGDVLCWDVMEKAWGPPPQNHPKGE